MITVIVDEGDSGKLYSALLPMGARLVVRFIESIWFATEFNNWLVDLGLRAPLLSVRELSAPSWLEGRRLSA